MNQKRGRYKKKQLIMIDLFNIQLFDIYLSLDFYEEEKIMNQYL